jgi:hypothetical protein
VGIVAITNKIKKKGTDFKKRGRWKGRRIAPERNLFVKTNITRRALTVFQSVMCTFILFVPFSRLAIKQFVTLSFV